METGRENKVQKISASWLALKTRFDKFRKDVLRNYRYVIGDQIDADILKQLAEERRPALITNLLRPLIVFIAGTLSENKQAMKATPLRFGDEQGADLHTVLVSDYAMEGCDGYYEIVKSGLDAVIAKVGWLSNYWTTRDNPEGKWVTEAFDPLMIMWDPDGRKEDQSDWRYQAVSAFYSAEEIISTYGEDLKPEIIQQIKDQADRLEGPLRKEGKPIGWIDRVWAGVTDWARGERTSERREGMVSDFVDSRTGIYRVIEWHEKRMISKKWVYSPQTRDQEMIPADKELDEAYIVSVMQKFPGSRIEHIVAEELWVVAVAPGLLPDEVILEKPYAVQGHGFQHKPIFCDSFHPDLTQTGSMVDALIGPLDSYNQRRMTMLEYIMDTVNPKIRAPKDSIAPEDMEDWLSKERGVLTFYTPVGGLKPESDRPTMDANALKIFADDERDVIPKLIGVTPNLQGLRETSNEPSSLYRQRVQQGMVMMSFFNSHVQRTMRQVFRYCDRNLQEFMTIPKMVRLLSEPPKDIPGLQQISKDDEMAYWLQVNWPTLEGVVNDVSQGEFDFKPDFQQLGQTAKQMKFLEAIEFVKMLVDAGAPAQAIKYSELFKLWDSPVSESMARYFEQMMGVMTGQARQAQQLQEAQAEIGMVASAANAQKQIDPYQQAQERATP